MTIREQLEAARARDPRAAGGQERRHARTSAARARRRRPAGVSARPRPHHPLQGVPPPEAQDAGVLRADRRSLPHAADAHARGLADRAHDREGAAAARGADRGDRARPRSRPHAVRPRRRARARARSMPGGFNHYEQSLRIVDVLENDGRGLNLTWEVRDGIAKHSKGKSGAPVGVPARASRRARSKGRSCASPTSSPTSTTTSTTRCARGC